MADFVLDASVAISWCFPGDPNEDTSYSRSVLTHLTTGDAVVPEIWPFEIANKIFVSFARRKRINEHQVREYLLRLKALPIQVRRRGLGANIDLESAARRLDITAYDAAYLELARAENLPLATSDHCLRQVAHAEGIAILA